MKNYRMALTGILALATLILLVPAGRRVLWSSNEARYSLLAQDILDHQRWLVPELRGQLYLNKPQLHFWAIAVASLPAGRVTELSGAIPSVLSSVAAVGAVVAIGTLLWGHLAGLLAGLILATSLPFFAFGHLSIPDVMLGAFLTWALYWFLRAWRSEWARGSLVGFYLCVALAIATKGPAGYVALAAAAIAVLGTDGRRALTRLRPALGLLILAVCALPWIVPYYLESRGHFQSDVLVSHYGTWFFHGSPLSRLEGIGRTLGTFLPWSIFLLAGPWWWRQAPDDGRRRVVLWTLTVWALLVLTGKPRSHYLVPIYPLFALLTAEFVARGGASRSRPLRVAAMIATVYAITMVLVLILRPTALGSGEDTVLFPEAWWERAVGAAIVTLGAAGVYPLARRDAWAAVTVAVALTLAALLVLAGVGYPARQARDYDVRPLAAAAAAHLAPGGTVVGHPDLPLSYDFYMRRPVVEIVAPPQVMELLASPTPGQVLITSRARWQALIARAPSRWRVLAARVVDGHEVVVVGSPGS
ncbi:MAG TPA: glycosyltransferase family 39 protein [Candidatus Nitrosotalea sp.]|nr:glycosyltransferase family 39 protein [Candidatus Nitrosotalea sp.]